MDHESPGLAAGPGVPGTVVCPGERCSSDLYRCTTFQWKDDQVTAVIIATMTILAILVLIGAIPGAVFAGIYLGIVIVWLFATVVSVALKN